MISSGHDMAFWTQVLHKSGFHHYTVMMDSPTLMQIQAALIGLSMLLKNKREHEVGRGTCSENLGKVGRGKKVDIRKSH